MVTTIPSTIRAITQPDANSTILTETPIVTPVPTPNSTEHLIRVRTAAFCNGELLWAKNFPSPETAHKLLVPCDDVAGTVVSAPADSPFVVGSEVYARTSFARPGNAREYSIALTSELAFRPTKLTWAQSASVPLSALTAWQALFVHAGLPTPSNADDGTSLSASGKRILIIGAAGAVGIWAVQFAKLVGAEVIATGGRESFDFLKSIGASEVLDYKTANMKEWAASGQKVDIVLDCYGHDALRDAWWAVKDDGVLMSIFQPPQSMKPEELDVEVKNFFFIMEPNGKQLQKITDLIDNGDFQIKVDSVWSLDQYKEAWERFEHGRPRGKVVFDLLK
jgi:NADPH:quinone reductase-like Zn-dependent oxidoreductase